MTPPRLNRLQLADELADVEAQLAGRNITAAERDELLAQRRRLRAQLAAVRRYAATRPPHQRRR